MRHGFYKHGPGHKSLKYITFTIGLFIFKSNGWSLVITGKEELGSFSSLKRQKQFVKYIKTLAVFHEDIFFINTRSVSSQKILTNVQMFEKKILILETITFEIKVQSMCITSKH